MLQDKYAAQSEIDAFTSAWETLENLWKLSDSRGASHSSRPMSMFPERKTKAQSPEPDCHRSENHAAENGHRDHVHCEFDEPRKREKRERKREREKGGDERKGNEK